MERGNVNPVEANDVLCASIRDIRRGVRWRLIPSVYSD